MKPALFSVLCEIKEKTGKIFVKACITVHDNNLRIFEGEKKIVEGQYFSTPPSLPEPMVAYTSIMGQLHPYHSINSFPLLNFHKSLRSRKTPI